ncbi:MAG: hypothetical protein WC877_01455 [Dehalococcoidales bacterium]|jgi:hypothetical protein
MNAHAINMSLFDEVKRLSKMNKLYQELIQLQKEKINLLENEIEGILKAMDEIDKTYQRIINSI